MNLLDGLEEYPVRPYVVVPKESAFTNELSTRNIPYKIAPVVFWVSGKQYSISRKLQYIRETIESARFIRQLIKEWKIEIIYTNSSVSPVGRLAAMLERLPHIWHQSDWPWE